jgi:hypothetical protein
MKQRRRIYYSSAQRSEIWDRWQAGESMSSIGRRFDRESSSVFSVISPTGGIRPPIRQRPKKALSLSEREEISRGLSTLCSLRSIARHWDDLHRPSAVKSVAMVAWIAIGLPGPIKPPGAACLSRYHFVRAFNAATGKTPYQYLGALHLDRARELLSREQESVGDIAYRLQFSNSANFCRAFKRDTGFSPKAYRNQFIQQRR